MNLIRIAMRVARLASDYDGVPQPDLHVNHADTQDVLDSVLSPENKDVFLGFIRQKESFQDLFEEAARRTDAANVKRVHFGKAAVMSSLRFLMDSLRSSIERWNPQWDAVYDELMDWQFPETGRKFWQIDVWVSSCHELASALFEALGGRVKNPIRPYK